MTSVKARSSGLHLRDTLLVLHPGRSEYALLFRVPSPQGNVETVLFAGTGALSIDPARIRWRSEEERRAALPGSMPKASNSIGTFQTRDRSRERPEDAQSEHGRWPTNVALVHGPSCLLLGSQRVDGHRGYPNGPGGKSYQYSSSKRNREVRPHAWKGHADEDGKESIPQWECQPNCPATALDKQHPSEFGASRLFPQFADRTELLTWIRKLTTQPGSQTLEMLDGYA